MKKILGMISLIVCMEAGTMNATQRLVPSGYATIQAAVSAAGTGDTIIIAAGTYHESLALTKSIVLIGSGSSTIISPTTGPGFKVSVLNVVLDSMRVTNSDSIGIAATSSATNLILSNVSTDNNAKSGVQLASVNGATITNLTASSNKEHGLAITGSSKNITVVGGTFNSNGVGRGVDGTGGGIYLNPSTGARISNITIQGTFTASNNTTAGILAYVSGSTDSIKTLTVGASGSATMSNNGGAGIVLCGNVENATVTGTFTKGSAVAAGVLIVGSYNLSPYAPVNTIIKKCVFNTGYNTANSSPAISLSTLNQFLILYTSIYPVFADSNIFHPTISSSDPGIDTLIFDQTDDPDLGLVTHTDDNALPVELTSFSASAQGREVELVWHTATEVNNYGFEVERRPLPSPPLKGEGSKGWGLIGFAQGMGTTNAPHSYLYRDETSSAGMYEYRLKQIDRDGRFEYSSTAEVATTLNPGDYTLSQNYPNPFNPSTKIQFALSSDEFAVVKVFDGLGREVETLFNGVAKAGVMNELEFNGSGHSSGVYYYSLTTKERQDLRKMILIK